MAYYATAKIFADPFGSFLRGFRQAQEDDRKDLALLDQLRRTELAALAETRKWMQALDGGGGAGAAADPAALADQVYDSAGAEGVGDETVAPPGEQGKPGAEDVSPPAPAQEAAPAEVAPPPKAPIKKDQERLPGLTSGLDTSPTLKAPRVTPAVTPQSGAAIAAPVPAGGQTLAERALLRRDQFRNPEIPSPADAPAVGRLKDYLSTPLPVDALFATGKKRYTDRLPPYGTVQAAEEAAPVAAPSLPEPVPPPKEPPGPLPQRPAGSRKYIHDRIQPDQTLNELQRAAALVQQISKALQDPNLTPAARQQLQGALQKVRNRIQQLRGQ